MNFVNWRAALSGVLCSASIAALLLGAAPSMAVPLVVVAPDQGTLILGKTNGVGTFKLVRTGQADVIQKYIDKIDETGNPVHACKLVLRPETGAGVGLVTLAEAVVGFTEGYIGMRPFQVCSEITGSEALTFALGGVLDGFQVSHTELNLRMKGASIARIDTLFNGQTRTFIFKAPGSVYPGAPPAGATIINCTTYTNGLKNECRLVFDDLYTSMTITTVTGRISVNGWGIGLPESQFKITKLDQELGCDAENDTVTATDPNGATAVGTRQDNTDGEPCDVIPVALTWDNSDPEHPALVYAKDDLGQAVVTTFTITWPDAPTPIAGPNGVIGAVGVSQQEFDASEGLKPLDLCVGTPVYALVEGEFVLESLQGITAAQDQSVSTPGIQYGCVYERLITYPASGSVGLVEKVYLQGDWKALRP